MDWDHFDSIPREVRRVPIRTSEYRADWGAFWRVVALTAIAAVYIGTLVFAVMKAHGQDFIDHEHGVTVPSWYDPSCCNQQDCRPIDTNDVAFGLNSLGNPVVIYQPFKIEFTKDRWKKSQDERYHACFRGNQEGGYSAYCIYLPALG